MRHKFGWMGLMGFAVALALSAGMGITALADEGVIQASNVKVRASASTSSQQISSVTMGDVVDIVGEETDSSGYVWYKIVVKNNEYGYVRSDFVQKDSSSETTETASNAPAKLPDTESSSMQMRSATVTTEKANVRGGAGKDYDSVGSVAQGQELVVTGEASGSDGKTWYQIQFDGNKVGFIRSDLISLGDVIPQETEEEAYEGEEESYEESGSTSKAGNATLTMLGNGEYSLAYKPDENGMDTWYLYDNVESTQVKLSDLLTAAGNGEAAARLLKSNKLFKIIVVIMAVVMVVFLVIIILLIYRLRDQLYYEADDAYDRRGGYDELSQRRIAGNTSGSRSAQGGRSQGGQTVRNQAAQGQPRRESAAGAASGDAGMRAARRPARPGEAVREGATKGQPQRESAPQGKPRTKAPVQDGERPAQPVRKIRSNAAQGSVPSGEAGTIRPTEGSTPTPRRKNFGGDDEDFEFEFLDLDEDK